MTTYEFTEKHPPLLADLGFDGITNIQESKGSEKQQPMTFSIKVHGPNAWPVFIPATVTRQKAWVRLGVPIRLSGEQTVSITETLAKSYTELKTLRALLSTSVGGSYGPFSAEINAEIETTRTETSTWSSSRSHTTTVVREGQHMYADWILVDQISIAYHLDGHDANTKKLINKAVENMRYYETFLSRYEDDLQDDEAILREVFAAVKQEAPAPRLAMSV